MDRSNDPAHVRVGISVGSAEDGEASARLLSTAHEVLARVLNLVRLAVVALPILVQCFYIHSVDFVTWVVRLIIIYVVIGAACFVLVPEQLYNGMGLASFRWLFERFYPDIALANGSLNSPSEQPQSPMLGGRRVDDLHGLRIKIRWHGTSRYLSLSQDGWAITSAEKYAATVVIQRVFAKGKQVPDTYTFRIVEQDSLWHHSWLAFSSINHLGFGGWLGAFSDPARACPYKVLQDSSCPPGVFKLLCAWTGVPPPTQRYATGFYMAEQISGGQLFVGHAPDKDAALLEVAVQL